MPDNSSLLLLDRDQAGALLRPDDVLDAVRDAFLLHASGAGKIFPLVREALPAGVFGIKSGGVAERALLGMKAAGFWPGNRAQGADGHQATIMLFDPATGRPQCVIDGNAVTTTRTAAAGAVGLLALARVWADDLTQARAIGELQWVPDTQAGELGALLAAGMPAREGIAADAITIFDMTGIALQDLTVARMLYQRALANGTGTSIAWPW